MWKLHSHLEIDSQSTVFYITAVDSQGNRYIAYIGEARDEEQKKQLNHFVDWLMEIKELDQLNMDFWSNYFPVYGSKAWSPTSPHWTSQTPEGWQLFPNRKSPK